MDPEEDRQLPDDEDDAGQGEQDEEENNSQECTQLLMLILLSWEVLVDRIFVDETEESDVGEAQYSNRQYRPIRMKVSGRGVVTFIKIKPKKRIDDRKIDEPVVKVGTYEEILFETVIL